MSSIAFTLTVLSIQNITSCSYLGEFELVEGSHITEDVSNGLILSKNCAEKNGLKIGDKVTGINDPNNDDPEVDMEIVGLFDVVADKEDEANMYDAATLWDYTITLFVAKTQWKRCV